MIEDRESYIEELVMEFTRKELNEIASGLDLNPGDYPNKRAIAEAILVARELEEAQKEEITFTEETPFAEEAPIMEEVTIAEEAPFEYSFEEEVTKEVEKVSPDTVRGMINAFGKKAAEFNDFTREMGQRVQEQVKENEDAVKMIHAFALEFCQSVTACQQTFLEQVKENEAAVAAIMSSIHEQVRENENFIKQFYG